MLFLLPVFMVCLLLDARTAMDAASESCALFVGSVMPGLFPYMVLSLMLVSRLPENAPDWLLTIMGWCGGSPTGARLVRERHTLPLWRQRRIVVCCATMSPMFLLGTVPQWLGDNRCGVCLLAAVVVGGALTGMLLVPRREETSAPVASAAPQPLAFGEAVEAAARTMLLICGTMVMLRVAADEAARLFTRLPTLQLTAVTLLEVTCGVKRIAALCLPLPLRAALIAAATGFGGAAILLQNRASMPRGLLSLSRQLFFQLTHALFSFLFAYSIMLLLPE